MAIKAIELDELREMNFESYKKVAQIMLAKMVGPDGWHKNLKFIFIDDFKLKGEEGQKSDFELSEQPVFIAGTDFDKVWKSSQIGKLKKDGYTQDIMYGNCRHIDGTLHFFDLEGGSIMKKKSLDLKFKNYLKDMGKKSLFDKWIFHEGSLPQEDQEKENKFDQEKQKIPKKREEEHKKTFEAVEASDEESQEKYKNLVSSIYGKAKTLKIQEDEEFLEYYNQFSNSDFAKNTEMQKSTIRKIMALFVSYEEDEELFDTEEDKKAAEEERENLVREVPKLWKNQVAEAYKKVKSLKEELSEKDLDDKEFEKQDEAYKKLLDASGEVRSELMDILKFYYRLVKQNANMKK